jgi:hypothetical protein
MYKRIIYCPSCIVWKDNYFQRLGPAHDSQQFSNGMMPLALAIPSACPMNEKNQRQGKRNKVIGFLIISYNL